LDETVVKIVFHLYDDNHDSSPKSIGLATVSRFSLEEDKHTEQWLTLVPNQDRDSVSGNLKIGLMISSPRSPSYEVAILLAGVFLTAVSLFMGFYTWRSYEKKNL
jgi:hypothetical protein